MKILYVCDKLITFILNEIIELNRNNDVKMLAYYSERIFSSITEPILIKHGLEKNYFRYRSSSFPDREKRYIDFMRIMIHDFFVHPIQTLKVFRFILRNYRNPREGFIHYYDVRDMLDQEIDIIHSPFSTPEVIDKVYLLSEILNVPFTLCFRAHDIYLRDNLAELQKRTNRIRKASKVITIADYNRRYLSDKIDIDADIEIVHSAVNLDLFKPADVERSPRSIITVCRLSEEKGIVYLLEACHILNKRSIEYECTIIGEGPEKENYEKLIKERNIPNINFIDYLPHNEIKEHLNRSIVFVLPSIVVSTGLGDIMANSLKEAMAMQVPVITSRMRANEELIDDGINGMLVPPQDPVAIADAVMKIFDNPGLGSEMGAEGRKKIKNKFNTKIETGKLDNIFRKVIEHQRTGGIYREDKEILGEIIE